MVSEKSTKFMYWILGVIEQKVLLREYVFAFKNRNGLKFKCILVVM